MTLATSKICQTKVKIKHKNISMKGIQKFYIVRRTCRVKIKLYHLKSKLMDRGKKFKLLIENLTKNNRTDKAQDRHSIRIINMGVGKDLFLLRMTI